MRGRRPNFQKAVIKGGRRQQGAFLADSTMANLA
jgi:hypothetical protein